MPKHPKPPKLTPEEKKKLKEEQKILKQLAEEEGLRQVKRDHLSRELKYGQKSRRALEKKWIQMLMQVKLPELKTDLELLMNKTDLILDLKDNAIGWLLDELDESEELYNVNLRAHCSNMLKIYQLYIERLNNMKDEYDDEYKNLITIKEKTENEIRSMFYNQETYLKTMLYELAVQEKYTGTMERSMYMSRQKELEQKYTDDTSHRRKKAEDQFEKIWKCFTKTLESYYEQIKELEKDYDERAKRDNAIVKIITAQSQAIFNQYNTIRVSKEKQAYEKEIFLKRIRELIKEREFLHDIFVRLKKTYQTDLNYDEKILTDLVLFSNKQINKMKESVILVENILRMYSVVRKLETRREKILAFPKLKPKKIKINKTDSHLPNENFETEDPWDHLKHLTNFWQKCSQASLGRNQIHTEYLHLMKENSYLKDTIKSCLHYDCNKKMPPMTPIHNKMLKSNSASDIVKFL